MPSVIMAGGLFAMDRKLFEEIGEYDPEMQLYGGEEVRATLCIVAISFIDCGTFFRWRSRSAFGSVA